MRGFLGLVVVISINAGALAKGHANECKKLTQQLVEMQKAQQSILITMVNKNDSMASTLDQYANEFSSKEEQLNFSDILNLRNSAEAFRSHKSREAKLIKKFQKMSDSVVNKTIQCLAKASDNKSIRQSGM